MLRIGLTKRTWQVQSCTLRTLLNVTNQLLGNICDKKCLRLYRINNTKVRIFNLFSGTYMKIAKYIKFTYSPPLMKNLYLFYFLSTNITGQTNNPYLASNHHSDYTLCCFFWSNAYCVRKNIIIIFGV